MTNDIARGPGVRLPWAGKIVNIEDVETQLSLLWKISADNMRTGQNVNVRTSVLNLVICAPDIESAQHASRVLRELSSTHLARVAILILDKSEEQPDGLWTWVTLRCFSMFSDLMRHCFEQTTVLATGSAIRAIGNIMQPLLKPDLPVYLWWLGDPPDIKDPTFNNLMEISDRVIFDSTGFFNPEQDIYTLAALPDAYPDTALSDLNWGRITPWLQLVAQFFDTPEYRPYLAGVNSIEIEHAVIPLLAPVRTEQGDVSPNPVRALLLAGWLKTRLGWELAADTSENHHDTAGGTYYWTMERSPRSTRLLTSPRGKVGKGNANISIRPQVQAEMRPGSICLVRLTSNIENKRATFTINLAGDTEHVFTAVELGHETRAKRLVSLAAVHNEGELLHNELEVLSHDYLFEQILREVAGLLEAH
ncbi:MAG TPA: glucose-6-phosphate dehydrogenase assembly protein OpcA [Ktedonobacteraceae bacterium]|jgi:glucose-6-phosphate dehydrogenase assembly protein OpcA|nr:glucose-6-phosphate dehydrogenase assembly protein OpcA [Ktedonobacteraceae bacterium]